MTNTSLIIETIIAVAAALFSCAATNYYRSDKETIAKETLLPHGVKSWLWLGGIFISIAGVLLMCSLYYQMTALRVIKRLFVVMLLWPIAASDMKQMRIPNRVVLIGLILRLVLIPIEFLVSGSDAVSELVRAGVGAAVVGILCIACMLVSKGSLGMGDLKLMIMLALFLGVEGIFYAMFAAVFIAFFVAIGLLISKKKARRDAIPFAPFVLIGSILSLILTGT